MSYLTQSLKATMQGYWEYWSLAGTYGLSLSASEAKGKLRWFLGYEIPLDEKIPALPRVAELLAVDGVPVDAWERSRSFSD